MRRKRLLILVGVALAAAVIVPAALKVHAYRQKVARGRLLDQEHCDRIKEGMNLDEVEAILGGSPDDFTNKRLWFLGTSVCPVGGRAAEWIGNQGRIVVAFTALDRVNAAWFKEGVTLTEPSLAERVRAWLRRLWP